MEYDTVAQTKEDLKTIQCHYDKTIVEKQYCRTFNENNGCKYMTSSNALKCVVSDYETTTDEVAPRKPSIKSLSLLRKGRLILLRIRDISKTVANRVIFRTHKSL